MTLKYLIFILLPLLDGLTHALQLANSPCTTFNHYIYCYQGFSGPYNDRSSFDTSFYILDLGKVENKKSQGNIDNAWRVISISENFALTKRQYPQIAKISDDQFMIYGGAGTGNSFPQTLIYNVKTYEWTKGKDYIEGIYGKRQMYHSAVTVVPGKGVAFFDGYEYNFNSNWTMETSQNLSSLFSGDKTRKVGFTSLTYYDYTQEEPWIQPAQTNNPTIFTARPSSVYNSEDKKIYFFGGSFWDTTLLDFDSNTPVAHNLSYATYFDTVENTWGKQTLHGEDIPSPRNFHTTLMLPKSPNLMILYGGETPNINEPVNDYCYLLDLKTFEWKKLTFDNVGVNDFIRTRHSGLLVDDETFVVVLGFDGDKKRASRLLAFDVGNTNNVRFLPNYSHSRRKISKGAIGGIVIGAIAFIGIFTAFFVYRYVSNKKKPLNKYDLTHDPNQTKEKEPDWIEVDQQYLHNHTYTHSEKPFAAPFVNETYSVSRNSFRAGNVVTPNVCSSQSISSGRNTENSNQSPILKPDASVLVLKPVSQPHSSPQVVKHSLEWSREEKTQL